MKKELKSRFDIILKHLPELEAFALKIQSRIDMGVRKKGAVDLVTEADTGIEQKLRAILHEAFPEDSVLGEEGGSEDSGGKFKWIIDPIDGTTNFAHRLPLFGISIGLEETRSKKIVMGILSYPALGDRYHAIRGKGAFKNNKKIHVSKTKEVINGLATTGFPYKKHEVIDSLMVNMRSMLLQVRDVRRTGSASLDLCWIAEGRFDIYWETSLSPWDTAAASLVVEEAGGKLTTMDGKPFSVYIPHLLATNGLLHSKVLKHLTMNRE